MTNGNPHFNTCHNIFSVCVYNNVYNVWSAMAVYINDIYNFKIFVVYSKIFVSRLLYNSHIVKIYINLCVCMCVSHIVKIFVNWCVCMCMHIQLYICIYVYLGGAEEICMKKVHHLFLVCLTGQLPKGHIFHVEKECFCSIFMIIIPVNSVIILAC